MDLKPFRGGGSTPTRRRFWSAVHAAVVGSRKIAGRHISVDEHPGKGTVINVDSDAARRGHPPSGGLPLTEYYCAEHWGSRDWVQSGPDCDDYGPDIQPQFSDSCIHVCGDITTIGEAYAHAVADFGSWTWAIFPDTCASGPCRWPFTGSNTPPTGDPPFDLVPWLGTYKSQNVHDCNCPPGPAEERISITFIVFIHTVKLVFKLWDPSGTATARWRVRNYTSNLNPDDGWSEPVLASETDYEQEFTGLPTSDYEPDDCYDERLVVTDLIPYPEPSDPTPMDCEVGGATAEAIWIQIAAP